MLNIGTNRRVAMSLLILLLFSTAGFCKHPAHKTLPRVTVYCPSQCNCDEIKNELGPGDWQLAIDYVMCPINQMPEWTRRYNAWPLFHLRSIDRVTSPKFIGQKVSLTFIKKQLREHGDCL